MKINGKTINRSIVGHWVTVKWDDVGRRDGLVVEIKDDGKIKKNTSLRVFEPYEGCFSISADQIIDVRKTVMVG